MKLLVERLQRYGTGRQWLTDFGAAVLLWLLVLLALIAL